MSSLHEAIRQRRSIRRYQTKLVSKEQIYAVLAAAGYAPSAHNSQPWRFIIVEDYAIKRELSERMAAAWAADMEKDGNSVDEAKRVERRERFASAPVLIVACLSMERMMAFPDEERQRVERDLTVESLAAAIQNMLLTAQDLGLGACWYCAPAFCKQTVRETLNIPQEVEPSALILMGYPSESPNAPPKNATGDYCYVDGWGKPLT
jgi:coenzyme F420-0:L-glutamate ligase / coenzyme F420-1:gamma-L-glutamate ligase